jgi:Family of unknown function (DUF6263)
MPPARCFEKGFTLKTLPRLMRTSALALALVVGLPAIAANPTTSASITDTFNAPAVELIAPGTDPRTELRYAPEIGDRQTVRLEIKLQLNGTVGQQNLPALPTPTVTLQMDLFPSNIEANGDIAYTSEIISALLKDEAGADATVTNRMRETLSSIVGVKGQGVTTSRGFNKSLSFQAPATADSNVLEMLRSTEQSIQQLGAPFPAEPVGVGASWRVSSETMLNGVKIFQSSTYTLENLNNGEATLSVTVSQAADRQSISAQGLPADMKAELVMLQGDGVGRQTISLTKLAPSFADFNLKTTTESSLTQGQTNVPAKQTMDLAVVVETIGG